MTEDLKKNHAALSWSLRSESRDSSSLISNEVSIVSILIQWSSDLIFGFDLTELFSTLERSPGDSMVTD